MLGMLLLRRAGWRHCGHLCHHPGKYSAAGHSPDSAGGAAAAVSTLETLNNLLILILAQLSSTRLPAVQCSLLTRPNVHRFTTIEYLSV